MSLDECIRQALATSKVMRDLGSGGGYILAPTHYLLPDVPPQNVIELRDAVMECGGYPLERG